MKQELQAYYNFKLLAIKIGSTLKLDPKNRDEDGTKFLDECISKYRTYFEGALVLSGTIDDKIVEMPERPKVIKNVLGEINVVVP
jgi:hypothetical protein